MEAPRELLVRAFPAARAELRAAEPAAEDGTQPARRLVGHFAVFNRMTIINDIWEGTFREQIAPGAFAKTFRENRDLIRCIYEHGRHPVMGRSPIGVPEMLNEDRTGAFYDVALFDTAAVREHVIPQAEGEQLGASFAFDVLSEKWEDEPDDGGLPIRTILEARVYEFGPCPFAAYSEATAGVRAGQQIDTALWRSLDGRARRELAPLILAGEATFLRTSTDSAADTGTDEAEAAPAIPAEPQTSTPRTSRSERRQRALAVRGVV